MRMAMPSKLSATGIERTCRVETEKISDPTLRGVADKFLGVGETIFDMVQGTAVNSEYFKRDSRR